MKRTPFAETFYIMNRSGLASLLAVLIALAACNGALSDHERLAIAREALAQGKLEQARVEAETVHEASPDEPEARKVLAAVHRDLAAGHEENGALQEAHDDFVRAASLEPHRQVQARDWFAAWKVGRDAGLEVEALNELLTASLAADPSDLDVRRAAASSYDEQGDEKSAILQYLWVWEADRADIPIGLRLGSLYVSQGQHKDAEAVFQRILERDPENVQAQLQLAEVYEAVKRADLAEKMYRQLVKAHGENPMILFRYADFLERNGRLSQAESYRARARGELPGVERREMRELKRRKKR